MGVSGCGKSSVAKSVADRLGYDYHDADNYHPESNKEKMKAGIPLNDEDRAPWLQILAGVLDGAFQDNRKGVVLACSALKRRYRDILRGGRDHTKILFVHLRGSKELILSRMIERQRLEGHYMPPSLLDSQLAALENPSADEHALSIDIDTRLESIVDAIVGHIS
jgi:gluconokinase